MDVPCLEAKKDCYMKKKLTLSLLSSLLVLGLANSNAQAQSAFTGFYGQVGIGYENMSPTHTSGSLNVSGYGNIPVSTSVSSQGSAVGVLTVGYVATITKDFLLGIGIDYEPFNSQSGNFSYTAHGFTGTQSGTWKKQNSFNVFLAPATPIGASGLLYGKVGYSGASVQSTDTGTEVSTNLSGYILGVGYKQMISGSWYGFGEVNYTSYGSQTSTATGSVGGRNFSISNTIGANATNVVVGVGYRF